MENIRKKKITIENITYERMVSYGSRQFFSIVKNTEAEEFVKRYIEEH